MHIALQSLINALEAVWSRMKTLVGVQRNTNLIEPLESLEPHEATWIHSKITEAAGSHSNPYKAAWSHNKPDKVTHLFQTPQTHSAVTGDRHCMPILYLCCHYFYHIALANNWCHCTLLLDGYETCARSHWPLCYCKLRTYDTGTDCPPFLEAHIAVACQHFSR